MKNYLFAVLLGCLVGVSYAAAAPTANQASARLAKQTGASVFRSPVAPAKNVDGRAAWNSLDQAGSVHSWSI